MYKNKIIVKNWKRNLNIFQNFKLNKNHYMMKILHIIDNNNITDYI